MSKFYIFLTLCIIFFATMPRRANAIEIYDSTYWKANSFIIEAAYSSSGASSYYDLQGELQSKFIFPDTSTTVRNDTINIFTYSKSLPTLNISYFVTDDFMLSTSLAMQFNSLEEELKVDIWGRNQYGQDIIINTLKQNLPSRSSTLFPFLHLRADYRLLHDEENDLVLSTQIFSPTSTTEDTENSFLGNLPTNLTLGALYHIFGQSYELNFRANYQRRSNGFSDLLYLGSQLQLTKVEPVKIVLNLAYSSSLGTINEFTLLDKNENVRNEEFFEAGVAFFINFESNYYFRAGYDVRFFGFNTFSWNSFNIGFSARLNP